MPEYRALKEGMIFVYRMGRLCGGAHEISGIKAPLFLRGGGGVGWWGGWWGRGGGVHGVLVRDVVGGGGREGGGMGDGVLSGW